MSIESNTLFYPQSALENIMQADFIIKKKKIENTDVAFLKYFLHDCSTIFITSNEFLHCLKIEFK